MNKCAVEMSVLSTSEEEESEGRVQSTDVMLHKSLKLNSAVIATWQKTLLHRF